MSSVPQFTVTGRNERRESRRQNSRFEDHAASILKAHVSRLEVHRRSVLLFYLLFGLLAGFVLGLAGAKGVLANTVDAHHGASWTKMPVIQAAAGRLPRPEMEWDLGTPADPWPVMLDQPPGGKRYAAIQTYRAVRPHATPDWNEVSSHSRTSYAHKVVYLGLLALILSVTMSLTFIFWRHLNRAYSPNRRVRLAWGPRGSRRP